MSGGEATSVDPLSDPDTWVERHGDALFRYARLRVSDRAQAEDLVQETFLAALRARSKFARKSSERSWFVGILKHKIVDHLRSQSRESPAGDLQNEDSGLEGLFNKRGKWKVYLKAAANPRALLEQKEFWATFQQCLSRLPQRLAAVFSLRELEELSGEEVCRTLELSASNFWVSMYRARLGLIRCLDSHWFKKAGEKR
jgi:RNA polymerase sigma-70 factor (ECF subfamily)